MAWDHSFRLLGEGEIIRPSDECLTDSHLGWQRDDGRCEGKPAPSPLYTSHRMYRRKRLCPVCGHIIHMVRVLHAKFIFARTKGRLKRNVK